MVTLGSVHVWLGEPCFLMMARKNNKKKTRVQKQVDHLHDVDDLWQMPAAPVVGERLFEHAAVPELEVEVAERLGCDWVVGRLLKRALPASKKKKNFFFTKSANQNDKTYTKVLHLASMLERLPRSPPVHVVENKDPARGLDIFGAQFEVFQEVLARV